ncbi:MAG: hypothetical protein O7A63_11625 [Acidobacteria bacterium]|nr:hypothetical protein [Acidobacteriota bacterium]
MRPTDAIGTGANPIRPDAGTDRAEFRKRIELIEESYEFMLGYAAQGVAGDREARSGEQLRDYLERSDAALADLAGAFTSLVEREKLEPPEQHHAFASVLERDARDSRAAIRLVLAQPSISSQLIDNLNASIHLRALLTDLFLIDEILKLKA